MDIMDFIICIIIPIAFLSILVWYSQKYVKTNKEMMTRYKLAMDHQEESMVKQEESISLQKESIVILREIRDLLKSKS